MFELKRRLLLGCTNLGPTPAGWKDPNSGVMVVEWALTVDLLFSSGWAGISEYGGCYDHIGRMVREVPVGVLPIKKNERASSVLFVDNLHFLAD